MNVEKNEWETKLNNLHTRQKGISSENQIDYKSLLKLAHIGKKVLDIGCGTCWLKNYLPKETKYIGLDANKNLSGFEDGIIYSQIEETSLDPNSFETLFVFAALDGMMDLKKAISEMKRISSKNVVILTGIEIEPDIYHTHKITEQFLLETFAPFKCTVKKYVHPKIAFFEFTK